MKKNTIVCAVTFFLVLLAGCSSISNEDYENIIAEKAIVDEELTILNTQIDDLTNGVEALETENSEQQSYIDGLEEQIETLEEQIDYYENGAENQLIAIKNAFEAEEYTTVVTLADTLHQAFNGSSEDAEAQALSEDASVMIEVILAAEKEEEERMAAEAAQSAQDKIRDIIRISSVTFSTNSAGGVDVKINFTNNSEKEIKYVTFTVSPYNSVGDEVLDHSKYDATSRLQVTGPIASGASYGSGREWSLVWYNGTTSYIKVDKIQIEYMDGSEITISGDDVEYARY